MAGVPVFQSDTDRLFAAVGEALSKWTLVELQLGLLFGVVSQIPDGARASAAFDTIISFETRLNVVEELMAIDVTDELELEMWSRLSRRTSKFYKKRHEIAHFRTLAKEGQKSIGTPHIAPFFTYKEWMGGDSKTLSLDDIKLRRSKFEEIAEAIWWFTENAISRARPEEYPLPKDREDPPLIHSIRVLATQILEERQKQPPQDRG